MGEGGGKFGMEFLFLFSLRSHVECMGRIEGCASVIH